MDIVGVGWVLGGDGEPCGFGTLSFVLISRSIRWRGGMHEMVTTSLPDVGRPRTDSSKDDSTPRRECFVWAALAGELYNYIETVQKSYLQRNKEDSSISSVGSKA